VQDQKQEAEGRKSATILVFYLSLLLLAGLLANLTGEQQATTVNTLATITGVLLGLYSLVGKKKRNDVLSVLLLSVLASVISGIVSLASNIEQTTKTIIFISALFLFGYSTYSFATSVKNDNH